MGGGGGKSRELLVEVAPGSPPHFSELVFHDKLQKFVTISEIRLTQYFITWRILSDLYMTLFCFGFFCYYYLFFFRSSLLVI